MDPSNKMITQDPRERLSAWFEQNIKWLVLPIVLSIFTSSVYLYTHTYPAHISGMYLVMVDELIENGYRLPQYVPYYTSDPAPFAYPPLAVYISAIFQEFTGITGLQYARFVPPAILFFTVFPAYIFSKEIFNDGLKASITSCLIIATPQVYWSHLAAGGWIRGQAFLFTLCGLYTGLRLFRTQNKKYLYISAILFGLTTLTHPVYALFYGVSYILFYIVEDTSYRGLFYGAAVALGGVAIASPWLVTIINRFGIKTLLNASSTHGGIGQSLITLPISIFGTGAASISRPIVVVNAGAIGLGYLLLKRDFLLPVWAFGTILIVGQGRIAAFILSISAIPFVFDSLIPSIQEKIEDIPNRAILTIILSIVLIWTMAASGVYVGNVQSESYPQGITDSDVEAMKWIETETKSDATFIGLGSQAEWLPYLSQRTILISSWGQEWDSSEKYRTHNRWKTDLARCQAASCVSATIEESNMNPDYVYVPKNNRLLATQVIPDSGLLIPTMKQSERYSVAYENEGVAIFNLED